jgi:hypothetical protein
LAKFFGLKQIFNKSPSVFRPASGLGVNKICLIS